MASFELYRRSIAGNAVATPWVVDHLNVVKHICTAKRIGLAMMGSLSLIGAPREPGEVNLHDVQSGAFNGYFADRSFQSRGISPLPDALVQRSFVAAT